MENTTKSIYRHKCVNCGNLATVDSNFCSPACFEMWYSLENAKMLNLVLNKILDAHFGVTDAKSRIS